MSATEFPASLRDFIWGSPAIRAIWFALNRVTDSPARALAATSKRKRIFTRIAEVRAQILSVQRPVRIPTKSLGHSEMMSPGVTQ